MSRPSALLAVWVVLGCASVLPPTSTPAATPDASPTASPAPTSLPSPSPTTTVGLRVDPALITEHLDALQQIADDNSGIRAAGTLGYDASADYVTRVMTHLGYDVEPQSFDFPFFDELEPPTLTVGDRTWTAPEWIHAALYSGSGDVTGELEDVGFETRTLGCDASQWSGFTPGHIAVVQSGFCFTRQKVELAQQAGAVAMMSLVERWEANQIKRPTLLDPAGISIPVVVVGREPAQAGLNGQTATVSVHGDNHTATVDNVLATWPGSTDRVVMLGSHLDSVLDGPGINDNGSGVATLLALAASVAQQPQPNGSIRFAFWASEEFGDLGSANYVDNLGPADRLLIDAYLNLDMVGSPNPARYVYADLAAPTGSSDITQSLLSALSALGVPGVPVDMSANSDHFAFEQAGIPSGGVFSGLDIMSMSDALAFDGTAGEPQDPCYHLACDIRSNVDIDSATLLGQAIADVLYGLAY